MWLFEITFIHKLLIDLAFIEKRLLLRNVLYVPLNYYMEKLDGLDQKAQA